MFVLSKLFSALVGFWNGLVCGLLRIGRSEVRIASDDFSIRRGATLVETPYATDEDYRTRIAELHTATRHQRTRIRRFHKAQKRWLETGDSIGIVFYAFATTMVAVVGVAIVVATIIALCWVFFKALWAFIVTMFPLVFTSIATAFIAWLLLALGRMTKMAFVDIVGVYYRKRTEATKARHEQLEMEARELEAEYADFREMSN